MTAADLAGSVGDILAELGVVVIPQLQFNLHRNPAQPGHPTALHGWS